MEQNKDLKEMQENAESSIENTEEIVEETVEDTAEETVVDEDAVEESAEENAEITEATEEVPEGVKNKKVINPSIIIAIVIFVGAMLVFGGINLAKMLFFDNSIVGTWKVDPEYIASMSSPDEATQEQSPEQIMYYIFTDEAVEGSTGNEKVLKVRYGTIEQISAYTVTDNGDGTLTVTLSSGFNQQVFNKSTVSGNIFTGKKVTIADENNSEIPLVSATVQKVLPEVSEDFEVNDQLIGEWYDDVYKYKYIFNEDGTAFIDFGGMSTVEGTYVVADDVIKFTLINGEEITTDIPYSFDEDTLVISGLGLKKVSE